MQDCLEDEDCPSSQQCSNFGQCLQKEAHDGAPEKTQYEDDASLPDEKPTCQMGRNCPADRGICKDGQCFTKCSTNTQCEANEICKQGICIACEEGSSTTKEVCNGKDDNCNGQVDEGFDLDQDGFFDTKQCSNLPKNKQDCDDNNEKKHPQAKEVCNNTDDNCDGQVDEVAGCPTSNVSIFADSKKTILDVAISPDSKTIAGASEDHYVYLWDVKNKKLTKKIYVGYKVNHVLFGPQGSSIFVASDRNAVMKFDIHSGKEKKIYYSNPSYDEYYSISISRSRLYLAGVGNMQPVVWNLTTGDVHLEIRSDTHDDDFLAVKFSPDSSKVAIAGRDKWIQIWNVEKKFMLHELKGHSNWIHEVDFSKTGKQLLSVSSDRTVKLWDVITGKELHTFHGHEKDVFSVVFSPDNSTFLTAGTDKTIRVWDFQKRKEVRKLHGHGQQINSLVLSKDGKLLISGGNDSTVQVWK